jgi:cytochrome c biogenesis protein CcmG, thiol:disulfide interchange protein DsbE
VTGDHARWRKPIQVAAFAVAVALFVLVAARLLVTPVTGSVLVLASARQADHFQAGTLELHSSAGWVTVGRAGNRAVPAAPNAVNLAEGEAPIGDYDAIRVAGHGVRVKMQVTKGGLVTVLITVRNGQPVPNGIYAGGENVSLGLNELAGQLRAMPAFSLTDQFGRPFANASIVGHDVIVAAFHTTCQETCPLYTGLFMQLRRELPASVLLVEATTDPGHDTPEVLREYAGRVGASWAFVTGPPDAMTEFFKPFDVQLSSGDVHRSTLALIDSHGYVRSYYVGAPDVGGRLPGPLQSQLNDQGRQLLRSHGDGWGAPQILDTLAGIGGLSSPSSTSEGQAPDFTLNTLDGRRVSLADFRGRPVLLNFWASYCVPCRVEMPAIQREAAKHPGLVVLLVDERDDPRAARSFVADLHVQSTVLFDGDGRVGDSYGVNGLPTTVFARSDGTIEGRNIGQTNEQILERHIGAIGA